MLRLLFVLIWTVFAFADFSPVLLQNKSFKLAGDFYPYPFHPDSSPLKAYNWAFKTPLGHVYQMHGTESTPTNVFGWKRVDVELTTQPLWRFYFLGDLDKDGDTRFDFITIRAQEASKEVFKLLPTPVGSFFEYQNLGFLHFTLHPQSIAFERGFLRYWPLMRSHEFSTFPQSVVLHDRWEAQEFLAAHPSSVLQSRIEQTDFVLYNLILYRLTEPSGSIQVKLLEPIFLSDAVVKIPIARHVPQIGTADMAYHLAGILASKDIQRVIFEKEGSEEIVSTVPHITCEGEPPAPVCGLKRIECVTTPCEPILTTYPNYCALKADSQASFLHMGSCDQNVSTDTRILSSSLYHLGIDLAKRLEDGHNLFLSPLSIEDALQMLYAGAKGSTKEELASALGYPEGFDSITSFVKLRSQLHSQAVELEIADSAWFDEGFHPYRSYRYLIRDLLDAALFTVDFSHDPEGSRSQINEWVAQKTHRKIKDLLPPGSISSTTRAVLVDAVYFYGQWREEFNSSLTKKEWFYPENGQKVLVDMMDHTSEYNISDFSMFTALQLPYKKDFSMWLLAPKEGEGIADMLAQLGGLQPKVLYDRRVLRPNVELKLPKFTIVWGTKELSNVLKQMGIHSIFDPDRADLTLIGPSQQRLFLSGLFHKSYIEVDEKGSEAAAATAGVISVTATPQPYRFTLDRPFVFIIFHDATQTPLFMGIVYRP